MAMKSNQQRGNQYSPIEDLYFLWVNSIYIFSFGMDTDIQDGDLAFPFQSLFRPFQLLHSNRIYRIS